jgi:hypothetical protein
MHDGAGLGLAHLKLAYQLDPAYRRCQRLCHCRLRKPEGVRRNHPAIGVVAERALDVSRARRRVRWFNWGA